ncbi:hypothetical protein [Altibacter sp.]|uniref:hypothetical protein n=1 Tax=Altibacter sp. TaxID=2024823 RepID=UPI000C8C4F4A|nr:hypothetical protein [Altibacter sp.]MAP54903.1 hypothetical protein [Altibacter sp.]
MKNKRRIIIVTSAIFLLLLPLVAMEFTSDVRWSVFDFVIMGIFLLGTGLICELILRKVQKTRQRGLLCVAALAVFLLIWAELSIGIFIAPVAGD